MRPSYRLLLIIVLLMAALSACRRNEDDDESKDTSERLPTVAFMTDFPTSEPFLAAALQEFGYVEGESATYLSLYTYDDEQRGLTRQALTQEDIDVVAVIGVPFQILEYRDIIDERDIPVVLGTASVPILLQQELIESVEHPGGNFTGVEYRFPTSRALELFQQAVPDLKRVYVAEYPQTPRSAEMTELVEAAALLDLELVIETYESVDEYFSLLEESVPEADVDGVFLMPSPLLSSETIVPAQEIIIGYGLPTVIPTSPRDSNELYFMGYGLDSIQPSIARLIDKILTGTSPAEIPIEPPEYFLSINLQTANRIGIDIPDTVVSQADFLIHVQGNGDSLTNQ